MTGTPFYIAILSLNADTAKLFTETHTLCQPQALAAPPENTQQKEEEIEEIKIKGQGSHDAEFG